MNLYAIQRQPNYTTLLQKPRQALCGGFSLASLPAQNAYKAKSIKTNESWANMAFAEQSSISAATMSTNVKELSVYSLSAEEIYSRRDSVEQELQKMDMEGLTASERYKRVYDTCTAAFGEDFLVVSRENFLYLPKSLDAAGHERQRLSPFLHKLATEYVGNGFSRGDSVEASQENEKIITAAAKEALYPGMKSDEIRASIASKYPPASQMTNRDFYKMTYEMYHVGVDEGLINTVGLYDDMFTEAVWPHGVTCEEISIADREAYMNRSFSPELFSHAAACQEHIGLAHINDLTKSILTQYFGCKIGSNGRMAGFTDYEYEQFMKQCE